MGNIEKFFWEALFINHVNFSGMNLNEDQVSKLLEIFKGCQFLLGFHLSDNNIIRSCSGSGNEYFKGIMELFSIRPGDLVAVNRATELAENEHGNPKQFINYKAYLKPYFTLE